MLSQDIVDVPPTAVEPGGGTIVRVLLVHDEPTALTALRSALSGQDIAIVGSTDSGEHALELARILDPDIAVIRWSLRRFGGALTACLMQWHAPSA